MRSMRVVFVTDIYGVNDGVRTIVTHLENGGADVSVVSPYRDDNLNFISEEQAYMTFLELCGHENYYRKVLASIEQHDCNVLIGCSAGASAAWFACSRLADNNIEHLLCFYPTRIRKYLRDKPNIPATIIFPSEEDLFSVDALARVLNKIQSVHCYTTAYQHGFLNPAVENYAKEALTLFFEDEDLLSSFYKPEAFRRKLGKILTRH